MNDKEKKQVVKVGKDGNPKNSEIERNWSNTKFEATSYKDFLSYLRNLAEPKYQEFSNKLIPHVTNLIGIRLPILRKLAKQISLGDYQGFLANKEPTYFEEIMLRGFLIGCLEKEPFDVVMQYVREQVRLLNNWSTCDSFCASLKITRKYPEEMFTFLNDYASSDSTYDLRFFIVMCLNYFLDGPKLNCIEETLQSIKSEDYYVNMAIAWVYAEIFLRDKEMVIRYLLKLKQEIKDGDCKDVDGIRQRFIFQKTISKICDSKKVSNEEKDFVRTLRK